LHFQACGKIENGSAGRDRPELVNHATISRRTKVRVAKDIKLAAVIPPETFEEKIETACWFIDPKFLDHVTIQVGLKEQAMTSLGKIAKDILASKNRNARPPLDDSADHGRAIFVGVLEHWIDQGGIGRKVRHDRAIVRVEKK